MSSHLWLSLPLPLPLCLCHSGKINHSFPMQSLCVCCFLWENALSLGTLMILSLLHSGIFTNVSSTERSFLTTQSKRTSILQLIPSTSNCFLQLKIYFIMHLFIYLFLYIFKIFLPKNKLLERKILWEQNFFLSCSIRFLLFFLNLRITLET